MSRPVLIVKLGGDAVASPESIAAAAERIATLRASRDVVVVASARRGVTDHLLGLASAVTAACTVPASAPGGGVLARERAVASGEIVAASLVTLALTHLGVPAEALDARQAGLQGAGAPGNARLRRVSTAAIRRRLAIGVVPVVAGFQVADRGQLRLLGRGGSDITAVALGAALVADEVVFFKRHGLRHSSPERVPDAAPVGVGSYADLDRLLGEDARVLHPDAARLAARHGIPLAFVPFPGEGPVSRIVPDLPARAA